MESTNTPDAPAQYVTRLEAARIIGISRELWFCWERKGWMPEGSWVPKVGAGGMMKIYTPEEIQSLKSAIERGEHPSAKRRGTLEHTICRDQAAAMVGVTPAQWRQWEYDGFVPPGKRAPLSAQMGLKAGRFFWTPQEVEEARVKAQSLGILRPLATREYALTVHEAAAAAGISVQMWRQWSKKGIIPCGRWAPRPEGSGQGGLRKMYTPDEVRRAREALDRMGAGKLAEATPEHTIPQRQAARLLGVKSSAWHRWERRGLVPPAAWGHLPNRPGLYKLYTPAQVEEVRAALHREGVRCFALATPEHTITREQAARMVGVPSRTWCAWESDGRTPVGAWAPQLKGTGRRKLFTLAEMTAFIEELRKLHQPYPDPERPGCHRVPIRSYKRRMEALIDSDCLPLVEGKNWNFSESEDEWGRRGVVVLAAVANHSLSLKQVVTGLRGRQWRIRHANGDFLDCRRSNLLVLDIAEQCRGSRKMRLRAGRELTSKYKGVCWCEERGKWLAQIRKEGVHRHLGRFDDETDAALAYDKAASELFGEHARLNFPDEPARAAA